MLNCFDYLLLLLLLYLPNENLIMMMIYPLYYLLVQRRSHRFLGQDFAVQRGRGAAHCFASDLSGMGASCDLRTLLAQ